jgi:Ulp1 family protease
MLNDQTIDFYMKKIAVEDFPSLEDKGRCLVMSTYFYQKLTQKSRGASNIAERKDQAYERVKNWTKSINIFEKDFILIPIHAQ